MAFLTSALPSSVPVCHPGTEALQHCTDIVRASSPGLCWQYPAPGKKVTLIQAELKMIPKIIHS